MFKKPAQEPDIKASAAFNDVILEVTKNTLESGELEDLVKERILKTFSEAFDRALSYGDVRRAIDDRLKEVMIPYIEQYDMRRYVVKLDAILGELLTESAVGENRKILSNFKRIMTPSNEKTITLEKIFKEYCDFAAEEVDTSDFEVSFDDDDPTYEYFGVEVALLSDEKPTFYRSSFKSATLYFHPSDIDQKQLCFSAKLTKWEWQDGWQIHPNVNPTFNGLVNMNEFECFLMALSKSGALLVGDTNYLSEDIEPNEKPNCSWS